MTDRDIERLLRGRIPAGDEDPELARFLRDFEEAHPEPSIDHCEAAHLSAVFAAAHQLAAADQPVRIRPGTKEDTMKRRRMGLLVWVTAAALIVLGLGTTVAFAGPGVFTGEPEAPAVETSTTLVDAPSTTETTEAATTDATVAVDSTDTTLPGDTTTTEVASDSKTHPENFGATISALRHAGDHTPAAVIKGKKVPGYNKKVTTTTTALPTTTTTAATGL